MRAGISQVKSFATKISMSKHIDQLAIKTKEEKSVTKKENSVMTEIVKESKKSCRDMENSIAIE